MQHLRALIAIAATALLTAGCLSDSPVADPTITINSPSPTSTATKTTTVEPVDDDPGTRESSAPQSTASATTGRNSANTNSRGYTCGADSVCRYPDGSIVPGYLRCGISCGEPPTSGEVQAHHGCEAGYITDEALCAAVAGIELPPPLRNPQPAPPPPAAQNPPAALSPAAPNPPAARAVPDPSPSPSPSTSRASGSEPSAQAAQAAQAEPAASRRTAEHISPPPAISVRTSPRTAAQPAGVGPNR